MNWPLVSVLVPCYNHELYIEECLLSILHQDYPNLELIVIDDGSSDSSAQRIKTLSDVHGFQFYQQPNGGVSTALNNGLTYARGEFIVTHDSDDVMLPGRLRTQIAFLIEHPRVGCLGARAITIDGQGRRVRPPSSLPIPIRHYRFEELLAAAYAIGSPVAVYRREAVDSVGGYDPSIKIQDFQMTLKIAHAGYQTVVLPDYVTLYRRHDSNISKTAYKQQLIYDQKVIEPFREYAEYKAGRTAIINKALKEAVVFDHGFAWQLFKEMPLREWDSVTWRRFRRLVFKSRFGLRPIRTL